MDDSSTQKVWERPWSTEEMRAHCSSWNLAGDAGLLKHLQEFSQNLMQKTHTAEVALDSLLEDMRNTSVDVQNATNSLLMLSNNQFVENRVYDDCEDDKEEIETKGDGDKVGSAAAVGNSESALIAKAAEAILLGMSVIDTKFDCVEVPASDSEGEEDAQNIARIGGKSFALVLEPRNPYSLQPLPHLIGSKEFMEDDRVGLGGDEDDEEEEEEDDDVHMSIGQDLVAQGLNDSGSSLAGDMGDEGLFDEDEVDDRRVPKTSMKQQWESSSSNDSDDLVVENNVIRKKLKKNTLPQDNGSPFGNVDDDGDIFGGKGSSSGDEFMAPVHRIIKPSIIPKKPEKEDVNEQVSTKPAVVNHKKYDGQVEKKKTNDAKSVVTAPKTPVIPSDNLFGPPKDDWKDDEDGDSIFAATDGIFSGGRGLFDDLEDPFMTSSRRDTKQFLPASLPDKPPAFVGAVDDTILPEESKGGIFGDDEDDDDQDVFANILTKMKPPQQKQNKTKEVLPKKQPPKPDDVKEKNLKGVGSEGADSWLFTEDDQDDPLWGIDTNSKKEKKISHDEYEVSKDSAHVGLPQKDEQVDEGSIGAVQPKLPVGARSFYAGGIDPFALGKKLTKELKDKQKIKPEHESDDNAEKEDVISNKAAPGKSDYPEVKERTSEKKRMKESRVSPDSGSLFDDLDEGDDLFAPVSSKANKTKDITSSSKGDLFDDSLFAPKKAPSISSKTEETKKKSIVSGNVDKSKNLFHDFVPNDVNDDIFTSSNSLGSGPTTSKPLSSKEKKVIPDSSDPLFDDILKKDEELFPGLLEKNIFSKAEVEDDLFSGFTKVEEGKSIKHKKKESSKSIKTESQVPSGNDSKKNDPVEPGKVNQSYENETSDDLFGPIDATSSKKNNSKPSVKTEASKTSKEKPFPSKKIKNEFDDIFGDTDDYINSNSATNSVTGVPTVDALTGIVKEKEKTPEVKSHKKSNKASKTSKLENLFDDFENDNDDKDFLSSKKHVPSKSVKPSDSLFDSNSLTKKIDGKDFFDEFDNDGDGQIFSTPKGGTVKEDPLFLDDPLGEDDDLFSSLKPPVMKKTPTPSLSNEEESLVFSLESDKKKTEPSSNKEQLKSHLKESNAVFGKGHAALDEDNVLQVPSGGSSVRKSPPKTLNLEKVIPSPKPDSKVVEVDENFLDSNDAEDDKIVQAWMKGHPPPLRDSKVETAMDDDITPGYTPIQSYDDFGPAKSDDLESSYFADIPSASLLRSHGKERARIQSHRRPPSRKVRKGSAASVDPLPVAVESEEKPEPSSSATTLPSRDSVEEDGGSQGTIEEWSTPEAALASPPRTLITAAPPRSNPLSPSTDEEQDFFDVLPVGHYPSPPPMEPPSHLSPFTDALGGVEDVWDKDDATLFEDAQPMDQGGGSLWGSREPPAPPGDDSGWTPTEKLPKKLGNESGNKSSQPKSFAEGEYSEEKKDNDLFSKSDWGPLDGGSKTMNEQGTSLPKKSKKSQVKKESEKLDDDLWGSSVSSKLKDDIFAEDFDSSQTGDFDDIFQGQGDLFRPNKVSVSKQETKKVTKGNAGIKTMGKSLSKLESSTKAPVSLFDDEDDTEDLFSPHSSQPAPKKASNPVRKTSTAKPVTSEQSTKSSLVKVAAEDSIFDDPLMVLKRKE